MSLTDKLRSLIEATFTSKKDFIAKQALPVGYPAIDIPLQNVDGWSYVTTSDGYLSLDAFSADQVFLHSGLLSYIDAGDRKSVFIPVRKGDVVSVGSANYRDGSYMKFFKLIGGGHLKSLVLQSGGALCLRLSLLSKRFSISPDHKQCRGIQQRILRSHKAVSGLRMSSRRMMGTLCSPTTKLKPQNLLIEQQVCDREAHQRPMRAFLFQSRKETLLQEWSSIHQRKTHAFVLSLSSALHNLSANCEEVRHVA